MLRICIKGERELQEYRFDFESHLFSFQLATIVIGMNVCFKRKGVAYAWDMTFASGFAQVEFCDWCRGQSAVLGFQLNLSPCQKHGFRQRDFHVFGSDIGEIRCNEGTHR